MTGELAALGTAVLWAIGGVMLKPLSNRFPAILLNAIRCCGAVFVFAVIIVLTGKTSLLATVPLRSGALVIGGTVLGIGIGETLYVVSLRYLDVSRAYPLSACTYPIVTMAIAFFLFQETISLLTFAGIAVVLIGIYFLAAPSGRFFTGLSMNKPQEKRGMLLLSLAVIAWGISTIAIRVATREIDPVLTNFLRMTGTAFVLLPFALAQRRNVSRQAGWGSIGIAVANGVISFGLGGILFLSALQKSGASLTSVLTSTSPVFLLPMSIFFLKEKVTAKLIVGAVLSVLGICLTVLPGMVAG